MDGPGFLVSYEVVCEVTYCPLETLESGAYLKLKNRSELKTSTLNVLNCDVIDLM